MRITVCSANVIEQCELTADETLGDLKSMIYGITGIEPAAQIIEGFNTTPANDNVALGTLCTDESVLINVTHAYGTANADTAKRVIENRSGLTNSIPSSTVVTPEPTNNLPVQSDEDFARSLLQAQANEMDRAILRNNSTPRSSTNTISNNTPSSTASPTISSSSFSQSNLFDVFSKMKARKDFNELYDISVNFSSDPIRSVSNRAKRQKKPLFVFPYYPNHGSTENFCRQVLSTIGLRDFLNENFVCWIAEMDSNTAELLENVIGASQYPLVLVLADIEGFGLSVLKSIQSIKDVDQLLIDLLTVQDQYEVLLATAPPAPVSSHQMLMQEQNKEYEESLRRDQEIEKQKELALIQQHDQEMLIAREEAAKKLEQQQMVKSLPEEPGESEPNISKLNIRLPNGKRLERRFRDSDTLEDVYNFIVSQANETEFTSTDFDLVTTFPRHVHTDLSKSLKEENLVGRALLVAEVRV